MALALITILRGLKETVVLRSWGASGRRGVEGAVGDGSEERDLLAGEGVVPKRL